MLPNVDSLPTVPYRGFRILVDEQNSTTTVSWWHPYRLYMGYQIVETDEWAEGELLRYAMENIDRIWEQWQRIDYDRIMGQRLSQA